MLLILLITCSFIFPRADCTERQGGCHIVIISPRSPCAASPKVINSKGFIPLLRQSMVAYVNNNGLSGREILITLSGIVRPAILALIAAA